MKGQKDVIPASEARRESFLKKDSGQAGMTEKTVTDQVYKQTLNRARGDYRKVFSGEDYYSYNVFPA